ncbi:hypothetical protein [Pseudotabrizicola alkalilacus]|uniref:Uncharacterized protein n=1 Tax=Pseudotabrizicola alkalilacus TaxID=2305252 RepID=A0A411Z3Y1_9RHOB|nr:hypothetical protein [Pseudotabrizicola alkalilacus]RGP37755.1 hypothetical protein D1012_07545 [Pseudotabrizicola alkalilacus]
MLGLFFIYPGFAAKFITSGTGRPLPLHKKDPPRDQTELTAEGTKVLWFHPISEVRKNPPSVKAKLAVFYRFRFRQV